MELFLLAVLSILAYLSYSRAVAKCEQIMRMRPLVGKTLYYTSLKWHTRTKRVESELALASDLARKACQPPHEVEGRGTDRRAASQSDRPGKINNPTEV